ncbi:hypothetical protein LshimejAT787_2300110 [Lyophyllum shimeji]|uniref:Uncharacterized protein n=1 Tax=Lyophyllum shimeji TaxID=47721 RepID=A0A9P3Q2G2_LYOSH|nr:hypothetical protein LshimejAT787_2300110 [Lyophyllum shimeji]
MRRSCDVQGMWRVPEVTFATSARAEIKEMVANGGNIADQCNACSIEKSTSSPWHRVWVTYWSETPCPIGPGRLPRSHTRPWFPGH